MSHTCPASYFFFSCSRHHLDLHSFPTRRSSDLMQRRFRDRVTIALESHVAQLQASVATIDRKSTRLNSSHVAISYAVFCLKKKTTQPTPARPPSLGPAAPISTPTRCRPPTTAC